MSATVTFKINHLGMSELLKSTGVRSELTSRASGVLSAAQSSAPVESGAYRGSLRIEQATTDRAGVRVVAGVPYALEVEAATGNLVRALDAAR